MDPRYIVALEIASSKVKGAISTVDDTPGSLSPATILAIEEEEICNCVQYGRIQNVVDVLRHTSYVIQKLENRTGVTPRKVCRAYAAIGGRSLSSVKAKAEIVLPAEMEITGEIIQRLRQEAVRSVSGDKEVLEVIPCRFYVDNTAIKNPVGTIGSRLRGEFTIVQCSPVNKRNIEMVVEERLKIHIAGFIVRPTAIAELVLGYEEKQLGCVLVDFGAETTTISIYKDNTLQHISTLPIGSRNITRDITAGLNLTEERAEMIKREIGNAINESSGFAAGHDESRINCYVQARTGEIVANILAQISFAGFKPSDLPAGIIVVGRGAKLRNFNAFLESQSKMKVRYGIAPSLFRIADAGIEVADNIDVISILAEAGKRRDPGCLELPATEDVQSEEDTDNDEDIRYGSDDGDDDDPTLFMDDEEREEYFLKKKKEQERENTRALKKRQDEEKRRRKKQDEETRRRKKEEERHNKEGRESALDRLKKLVGNILGEESDSEDSDLDDQE